MSEVDSALKVVARIEVFDPGLVLRFPPGHLSGHRAGHVAVHPDERGEIVYRGANDPHMPISQGWLRAWHRALDPEQSRPFLPVHPHDRTDPLTPGVVYEVDVEILPTSRSCTTNRTTSTAAR